jgi:hypothetical protein
MKTPPPPLEVPPLKNARHHKFATAVLRGMSLGDAYYAAGYRCKDYHTYQLHGSKLRKHKQVAAYIEVAQRNTADDSMLTLAEKRRFLARIVRTPISAISWDENADLAKRICDTHVEKFDPLKAIELDNKMSGDDPTADAMKQIAQAIGALGGSVLPQGKL